MMMGMMAFWLLIPAVLVWALRGQPQNDPKEAPDGALQILEDRFARGEIDAEEFATRRTLIERGAQ
jgi:uncharacterized membrane protein